MKVYVLYPRFNSTLLHDQYDGMVVTAKNAAAARKLAQKQYPNLCNGQPWTNTKEVRCEQVGTKYSYMVLASFHAG